MAWADVLERQAGHIIVGVILLLIGAALWRLGVPKTEDIVPFALGVIARSMVSEKERGEK